jgi:Fe-S cluster assembly ATP-binding protein
MNTLEIIDLKVSVDNKEIIKGINMKIREGEIHTVMGPNGSGKTSLSLAIMGHPKYKIVSGKIILNGEDITNLPPDEKAKKGIFLAFQNPIEISGVKFSALLVASYNRIVNPSMQPSELFRNIREVIKKIGISESMLSRGIHEGFSGGEKKRAEVMQMLLLKPKIAILDEPDSGVDVDGLRAIGDAINKLNAENRTAFLIITHYRRILEYVKSTNVHVLINGKIAASGGPELAKLIDEKGYEWIEKMYKK